MHQRMGPAGRASAAGGRANGASITEGGTGVAAPRERTMGDQGRVERLERLLEITHELARSQAREELLLQRVAERTAQVLDADAVGVLLVSEDGFVLRGAAGAGAELFGAAGPVRARSSLATAMQTGAATVVAEAGGGYTVGAVPLRGAWQLLGVMAAARPTARRFSADDLHVMTTLGAHAATALENAQRYREVREADRRKDDFLARLAHELRNPLAPIVHALHLLDRVAAHEPQGVQLREIMARQTRHLSSLVDDLLDVSRIRLGKLAVRLQPLDLRDVVRRSFEALQVSRHAEGHVISLALGLEPAVVNGDAARLEQVVGNLLHNAVKYTPCGAPIQVSVERAPREAILRVHDRGIGIDPEMLPHIFQMFTQADRSLDRSQGGLGLGLALVHALVEQHGGSVTAESAGLGCGSQFAVRLPLCPSAPAPAASGASRGRVRPTRILVVEDNPDAREALRAVLELEGHRVAAAGDGADGVELGAAFRPEIAFIDLTLPGFDGYEVARRLRAREDSIRPVLIALTGHGQPEDRRLAQAAGFDGYLVKPVIPEELFEQIARVPRSAGCD